MMRRIIIPAAGGASRFGGLPKELLPISETDCSLTHAVKLAIQLGGEPVIITNPYKEVWHRAAMKRAGISVELLVRQNWQHKDLWGSIERGLAPGRDGGLILADTVALIEAEGRPANFKFSSFLQFGVFRTREPNRFSIILPESEAGPARIATKEATPPSDLAWGMVMWDAPVADFLLEQEIAHYDRAFELAMRIYKWETFKISSYHDLGTFAAYKNFINSVQP